MNVKAPSPPFRGNTEFKRTRLHFVLNSGGIGDYINWIPAIRWAIREHPHLEGYVVTRRYFDEDLVRLWLREFSLRYEVITSEDFMEDSRVSGDVCLAPNRGQYYNANNNHLFDLGWSYYAQTNPREIPPGQEIPRLEGNETSLKKFGLPKDFAVLPISATAENRSFPRATLREVSGYLRERGITPVFLGKKSLAEDYEAGGEEPDPDWGLDLREKTTLLEAACLSARALFTLGFDGGLLHLACCTPAPVIMAFTSVDPKLRVPPRREGARTLVVTPPESLPCRFCNTRMRFLVGHDFAHCLYGDSACTKLIDAPTLIRAIEQVIGPAAAETKKRAA